MFFTTVGYILVFVIMFLASMALVGGLKHKGSIFRALDMSLFLITFPGSSESLSGQGFQKGPMVQMEELLSYFSHIHSKGWNKFVYGEPYIALEIAVHHIGESIHFYMAVPGGYEQVFKEKMSKAFPNTDVDKVDGYDIFNFDSVSAGSYLILEEDPVLPVKTYNDFHADPLAVTIAALSRLKNEGEGAVLQILVRPSNQDKIKNLVKRVMKNDKFKGHPAKLIENKITRTLFDANIRIITSATTESRARHILNDIDSSFSQFSSFEMNRFRPIPIKDRELKDMLFKFSFRVFDNSKAFLLSDRELAGIFHFPLSFANHPKIKFSKN